MERSDVILRAASDLRVRYAPEVAALPVHASALVERLCAALGLELAVVAGADAMLGGAYSRLQLWDWAQPEFGGLIWIRSDLTPEQQAFAIAHELGHFSLHRGEGVSIHPVCNQEEVDERADPGDLRVESRRVEEYTPRARRELEANAFAAELLAPRLLVRRCFAASDGMDSIALAEYFGISPVLARQRLVDAVLSAARPIADAYEPEVATRGNGSSSLNAAVLIAGLDPSQQEAARTPGPALIVAGPGTGKTATLVGRVAHLIAERGIQPERVLALTFSNRAAGEMRGRLVQAGLPGERMPVMTIHAFAAALLREYAAHVPCAPGERQLEPDFRILDEADAFLLMEELLAELPLHYYRSLGNPTSYLRTLLADFAHARDNLLTPDAYLALVDAMPLEVVDSAGDGASSEKRPRTAGIQPRSGTYTLEQIARARERARAYGVWDRALRQRGLVDFGGLIQRAVELLRADPVVLAEVHWRYPEVLVDEFQDTNRAAAELLLLIAGDAGQGLWVVGDRNQSIYRWRGASPANLQRLAERYSALRVHTLRRCYRSVPAIVQLGSAIASRMADLAMPGSVADAAKGQIGDSAPAGASMRAMAGFPMADSTPAVLKDMWRPLELEPVRPDGPHPAVLRGEVFGSAAQEQAGLAMAIRRHRTQGFSYSDQAVLCRTHRQAYRIAAALVAEGVPVDQIGGFFERPEIKDARALLSLAAGPDVRGLLRAGALLAGLGYPVPAADEIAAMIRGLLSVRQALPDALIRPDLLTRTVELTPATREALRALGQVAIALRDSSTVSSGLVRFLLRPGGYAWRLLRIADGMDSPALPGSASAWPADMVSFATSSAQAQAALAALGELVRLAVRFDSRWTREEDFRVRLSRAVMHGQPDSIAVAPAAPQTATTDTGAPALAADVRDGKMLTDITADVGASDLLPVVPIVSCFLYYLDALRAAGVTVPLPAGEEDAVHVLTLHASKGLEFPVVYLPGLAQGQFPPNSRNRDEVCPPGFREDDAPGEHEAEERCLFYVGVTRARDVVVLTRALGYDARRMALPSSLLMLVESASAYQQAPSLLTDEELTSLAVRVASQESMGDEDSGDEGAGMLSSDIQVRREGIPKRTYTLNELEQYLECPLRYKYARCYGLLDPVRDIVHRFYRYVHRGRRELREIHAAAPDANWAAVEARLRARWAMDGPAEHAYGPFYWQHARDILYREWQMLLAVSASSAPGKPVFAQRLHAELACCIVEVSADRITSELATGSNSSAMLSVDLVRVHTRRPYERDREDLALPLYYLAHTQQYPGVPVRIVLAYIGDVLADEGPAMGRSVPGNIIDVTDEACKVVEKYVKPGRKQRSRLDKLDEAAAAIEAGRFPPRPQEERCAVCPFYSICPADPEAGEPGSVYD